MRQYQTFISAIALSAAAFGAMPVAAQYADTQVDTSAAVAGAAWADNVTITFDAANNTFNFSSDGIPSHGFADQYLIPIDPTSSPFADQPAENFEVVDSDTLEPTMLSTDITTLPVYSDVTTDTSLGQIGVAITGAQIFNDYENMERSVVAMEDNVIHDHAAFLDECNGHPLADGSNYHYHGIPVCVTVDVDQVGEHSYMIGVLLDGFPVYANQDLNGEIIGDDALDECSGHFGATPEFPEGIYHYHLTADEAPYMIDCYHGEVEVAANDMGQGQGPDLGAAAEALGISVDALRDALGAGGPPDFDAAAATLGISADALRAVMPAPGARP